jgi:hypothetical protein
MFLRATRLWREGTRDPIRSASLLILAISSIAFAVWLVSLARREWFVYDEFDYLQPAGEPLVTWLLRPHNEHTITFTKAWFGSLSSTLGLRGYGLYIGPLIVSHLVAVWLIYRLTWISTASRILASGIALVALTMGAAAGTLTWAGQLQYTGSVAAGLGAILLACQRSGRRETVVLAATTIFGTLNGTAFLAFGLAAATMYVARRRWLEATIAAAIPVAWVIAIRLIWAPPTSDAARSFAQVLELGPSFVYAVLNTAISETLHQTHLSAALLTAIGLGTVVVLFAAPRSRATALSGRVAGVLVLTAVLSMSILIAGRLNRGVEAASGGGYSYLFLTPLLPLSGLLLGQIARGRSRLGIAVGLLALSLMGIETISQSAIATSGWRLNGEHLMQTAAARLSQGMATYSDQLPVPDTAPTVTQLQVSSWATDGLLDEVIHGRVESDQVSLNMQWRVTSLVEASGVCRDLPSAGEIVIAPGSIVSVLGLGAGTAVEVRYPETNAHRRFAIPTTAVALESIAARPALLTGAAGSSRVCLSESRGPALARGTSP